MRKHFIHGMVHLTSIVYNFRPARPALRDEAGGYF